jgi:hypothetical protein
MLLRKRKRGMFDEPLIVKRYPLIVGCEFGCVGLGVGAGVGINRRGAKTQSLRRD